jgi:M6 family metalloprotease-like protein
VSILFVARMRKIYLSLALVGFLCTSAFAQNATTRKIQPIDPQVVRDQDDMTWEDYKPIPGVNWADPSLKPSKKMLRIAVLAADFPDQPFVMTLPKHSDPYGNPYIDPVKREEIPQFYADFWNKPQPLNNGHTIHEFWMELSHGQYGVEVVPFGPFQLKDDYYQYGGMTNDDMPYDKKVNRGMTREIDSLWKAQYGADIAKEFDMVLRIFAGYDETTVWQEFGEMKFLNKESIPAEWGNPDPSKPRWVKTRYTEWTSWRAGAWLWSNSAIIQGENSGSIRHEISHYAFRIGDNNNNPYVTPYRRAGSGPWDLMDRGSFNGPGGPHKRYPIPVIAGGSMPAPFMLRQKLMFGFIDSSKVVILSREGLAESGLKMAKVKARAFEPASGEYGGIIVRLDGALPHDRTPEDDPVLNPLSSGIPNYNFYSLEVVQRVGYDSFTPDNGVLLAKNKDKESTNGGPNGFNTFNWVIDAVPEDKKIVDFVRPDGTKVYRTIADYRQLNDALFHAGTASGSQYEWVDEHNRLHFYVVDKAVNGEGALEYQLAVRHLDGKGVERKLSFGKTPKSLKKVTTDPNKVMLDVLNQSAAQDVLRISYEISGQGWHAELPNALLGLEASSNGAFPIYVYHDGNNSAKKATLKVTVRSESDPSKVIVQELALSK